MKKFLRVSVFILLILWMTLIFSLSDETATESSDTSGGFSYRIVAFFYPEFENLSDTEKTEIIEELSFPVRKAAHFTMYGVLGALSLANVSYFNISGFKKNISAFGFAGAYAVTDELHQHFVEGRSCELRDWLIDCAGIFTALLFINLLLRLKKRGIKMRKKELFNQNQAIMDDLQRQMDENQDLKLKIEEQLKVIDKLNERITDLQDMLDTSADDTTELEATAEEETAESGNVMDYGAVIIGKVLLSAAEYCGRIKSEEEAAASQAVEEVFARTEEVKAEILSIISSENDENSKKQLMEREYRNAVSYFDRLVSRL